MEDSRIIELYESRDQQAISQSDMKYGGYCYSVGYNILGVREDTEECVNETWLRAWNSIPPQKPRMLSAFFGRITTSVPAHIFLIVGFKQLVFLKPFQYRIQGGF